MKDWFEIDAEVPFMMKVFQIKENKREELSAVTHADGSGRLQTVYKHTNPRYYALISSFNDIYPNSFVGLFYYICYVHY